MIVPVLAAGAIFAVALALGQTLLPGRAGMTAATHVLRGALTGGSLVFCLHLWQRLTPTIWWVNLLLGGWLGLLTGLYYGFLPSDTQSLFSGGTRLPLRAVWPLALCGLVAGVIAGALVTLFQRA